jgi:hypothetical protein
MEKTYVTMLVNVYDDVIIVYSPHCPSGTCYLIFTSMESLGLEMNFPNFWNLQPNYI